MAIYSVLLGKGHGRATGTTLIYTAPADGVVVVRDITCFVSVAGVAAFQVYGSTPGGAIGYLMSVSAPAAAETYHWSGRQVLLPGEELYISGGTDRVTYRVSGYLLGVS